MSDAARVRFPPPLLYLLSTGAGMLLHAYVRPWPLPGSPALRLGLLVGLALAGLLLAAAALRRFRATGQDPLPWTPTPTLITDGIYRWTRNPMYVALALLQAAVGAAFANLWIFAGVPVSLAAVYVVAVRPEERYLEEKFGEAYRRYRTSVRRWL